MQGVPARAILVLTFTNKMAAEFAERLERRGLPAAGLTCCTIHSFCYRCGREGRAGGRVGGRMGGWAGGGWAGRMRLGRGILGGK